VASSLLVAQPVVSSESALAAEQRAAALSPSAPGRWAYSTGDFHPGGGGISVNGLGSIGLDGSDQRTLTDPPGPGPATGYDHSPQWSPDGTWLAYSQNRPDPGGPGPEDHVVVIPRDGGEPQVVAADAYRPSWSPDGRHLAWVPAAGGIGIADVTTTAAAITVTNARTLALPDSAGSVGRPAFSPDGNTLVFSVGTDASGYPATLWAMATTGTGLRQISTRALESGDNAYAFSPDGTKVLYLGRLGDSGLLEALVVNADGSGQRAVSRAGIAEAAWAPSGDQIAVTGGGRAGIDLVGLDGRVLSTFGQDQFMSIAGLVFAPDGSRVYSVASPIDSAEWSPDLYAIPVGGGRAQRLTFDHSVFPSTVQADPGVVLRQSGGSPAGTAAAALTGNVEGVDRLVVAPADDYAAALAAAPLAAQLGAAELVSSPDGLSAEVLDAARRLHVSEVVLVGALSARVADELRAVGLTVSQVTATRSPYRLGAAVARRLTAHRAYLVPINARRRGEWKVPLATAGAAALSRQPLLFTKRSSLPKATKAALRRNDTRAVTLVGEDADVRPGLLRQLAKLGVKVKRLRSSDPYEISARFADRALASGAGADQSVLASGASWSSSVTAPALAALTGQVTLLVDDRDLKQSKPTATWLRSHRRITLTAVLMGGVRVVSPLVEAQLEGRV
jgi:Tol biopolymer transport system component